MGFALRITAAVCALSAATTTLAQEQTTTPSAAPQATVTSPQEKRPRYGFGISTGIVPSSTGRLDTQGLGISGAFFRGRFRIEPALGFYVARVDAGSLPASSSRSLSLGGGLLYEIARAENSAMYAGGRLGLSFAKQAYGSSSGRWSTGETLSAVLGGEYFPAPFVSIGLEAQAGLSGYQPDGNSLDIIIASTGGLLVLRFYVP